MMAGYSLLSLTGYAILMWALEFLSRVHGMDPVSAGQWMGIVGGGAGPLLVGALSDAFAPVHGQASIRYGLLCSVGVGVAGGLLLLVCSRYLEADIRRAGATAP